MEDATVLEQERRNKEWAQIVEGGMLTKVTETRSQGAIGADKRERIHLIRQSFFPGEQGR